MGPGVMLHSLILHPNGSGVQVSFYRFWIAMEVLSTISIDGGGVLLRPGRRVVRYAAPILEKVHNNVCIYRPNLNSATIAGKQIQLAPDSKDNHRLVHSSLFFFSEKLVDSYRFYDRGGLELNQVPGPSNH